MPNPIGWTGPSKVASQRILQEAAEEVLHFKDGVHQHFNRMCCCSHRKLGLVLLKLDVGFDVSCFHLQGSSVPDERVGYKVLLHVVFFLSLIWEQCEGQSANASETAVWEDEDSEAILAADFEIGHFLRERIVPRSVLYFTGEAIEDDDDDYDEEGEEADDERLEPCGMKGAL
ncbi:UNVERIFIED_CONTAM: hypothetical protein FKN15_057348 [Acipenser sinensis]